MQSMEWTPKHCAALRKFLAKGFSFARIADAINAKFNTDYTRNAAIGRARRMGLVRPDRPNDLPMPVQRTKAPRLHKPCEPARAPRRHIMPMGEPVETLTLRCVEIDPRHLSLLELERGDCRYPYGGDVEGEAITFCGHPRLSGTSYCAPHFHLTRGPDTLSERAVGPVALRLVEAA